MTEKQRPLFNIGSRPVDESDILTPEGKVKKIRKKKSNQPVVDEQITKKNEVPSIKVNKDKGEMTEYTKWINEH